MSIIAALDLGTNSTRFVCVDSTANHVAPETIHARNTTITRLGEGITADNPIKPRAAKRVCEAVYSYQNEVEKLDGQWISAVATSACRRATSDSVSTLFDDIEMITGIRPEIIDGEREAELTFKGVTNSLNMSGSGRIIDIGGGSTEWINFSDNRLNFSTSIPVGVVTLREKCVDSDSWTPKIEECVSTVLRKKFRPNDVGHGPLFVVGGTGTTVSSYFLDLDSYDPGTIHGQVMTATQLDAVYTDMKSKSFQDLSTHPMIQSGREDVILPGIEILKRSLEITSINNFQVSDLGILAGALSEGMTS